MRFAPGVLRGAPGRGGGEPLPAAGGEKQLPRRRQHLPSKDQGADRPAGKGTDSGYVPYTAYSAKKSYLDKHPEIIQSFTNALQKGMDFVQSHTPEVESGSNREFRYR